MTMSTIERLQNSDEAAIRAKLHKKVLESEESICEKLSHDMKNSDRVKTLLSIANHKDPGENPYEKFCGIHWTLALLADLEYPAGDSDIKPFVDIVLDYWLDEKRIKERIVPKETPKYKSYPGVPIIDGRARRCASQQGNALYSAVKLGFIDYRCERLAKLLIRWQWPDGGWNCDRKTAATNSSFMESLIPMHGLYLYGVASGDKQAVNHSYKTAEIFLKRNLFMRKGTDEIIKPEFVKLHYPNYWHYDILFALKVFADMDLLSDPRCKTALDQLESKRLPDGGFPAEGKYYKHVDEPKNGGSLANWGGTSKKKMNEFVSVDALYVLKKAGRV